VLQVQITAREPVVVAAVLAVVVRQLLLRVALVAVKADIFSPDLQGRAVQAALRQVFLVVPITVWVLPETVVAMTQVDL
tara:strand:+ start:189 stop:425 length:237 start_codon:yes stop_codon:yes gene_type:complete